MFFPRKSTFESQLSPQVGEVEGTRPWLNNNRQHLSPNQVTAQRRQCGMWWKYEFIEESFCFQYISYILSTFSVHSSSFALQESLLSPPVLLYKFYQSIQTYYAIFPMELCCFSHLKPEVIFTTSKFCLSTMSLACDMVQQ